MKRSIIRRIKRPSKLTNYIDHNCFEYYMEHKTYKGLPRHLEIAHGYLYNGWTPYQAIFKHRWVKR